MIFRAWAMAVLLMAGAGCGGALPPPDPFNLAEAKDSLSRGNYWYERGCFPEAERFFQGGLESARRSDEVVLIIRAQNSLGAAALARGETTVAANYLEQALDLVQGQPGQPELDKVLGNLGTLAYKLGRPADAEGFWQKAAEAALEKGQSPAAYYCDLARLYLQNQRPEFAEMAAKALAAAETPAESAKSIKEPQNKKDGQKEKPAPTADQATRADALNLAGQAALAGGDLAAAEARFRQALDLDRQTENTVGLAQDTEALGRLMLRLERPREAAGFFDRAFFLWLAVGEDRAADRIFSEINQLAKAQGFPKNLAPYREAKRNPGPHRLTSQCPVAGAAEAPAEVSAKPGAAPHLAAAPSLVGPPASGEKAP